MSTAMQQYVVLDGELVDAEQPLLRHNNRAFRYGDGIFESIRVANGRPLFLGDHINRLTLAMQLLSLAPPTYFTDVFFAKHIQQLLQKNGLEHARIRLSVFREEGGLYAPTADTAHFLIEAGPLETPRYPWNENGLVTTVYPDHFKPYNRLAGLKSANSLLYVLAGIWQRDHQVDECFILNEQERIAEAISSNVLIYKNGEVLTPAYTEAPLWGIMKEIVMVLVNRMNIDARPAMITVEDLHEADEIWLTNMVKGLQWVRAFDGTTYDHQLAAKVVDALNVYAQL